MLLLILLPHVVVKHIKLLYRLEIFLMLVKKLKFVKKNITITRHFVKKYIYLSGLQKSEMALVLDESSCIFTVLTLLL